IALLEQEAEVGKAVTAEGQLLQTLVVSWLAALPMPDATTEHGRRQITQMLEESEKSINRESETDSDADREQPVDPPQASPVRLPDEPMLRVTTLIGDEWTRDGRQLVKVYKSLLEPLPLAGARVDPNALSTALELEFPWMCDAIFAMMDDVRLSRSLGQPWVRIRPLLLVGPSGVGKTLLALRTASYLGTGIGILNAGGSSDNR